MKFETLIRSAFISALVFNAAALGAGAWMRLWLRSELAPRVPLRVLPVSGVTPRGGLLDTEHGKPCHVIRFASLTCPYCSLERSSEWQDLETQLVAAGCDSYSISPHGTDFAVARADVPRQMVAAVPFDFVEATGFQGTPTMVVADRNWNVIWSQVGVLKTTQKQTAVARLAQALQKQTLAY